MKKYSSIALIEFSSIATGIYAGDAMVKSAPIAVLKSGTVHNGKFIILIGGSVASVEEAYRKGVESGKNQIVDRVFLPDVHEQVHNALLGGRENCFEEALGVIETSTIAAVIQSADAAVKRANINIIEIRIADDIGGKGFAIFNGKIEEIEEALHISREKITNDEFWLNSSIIPRLHDEMADQVNQSTVFQKVGLTALTDGEV